MFSKSGHVSGETKADFNDVQSYDASAVLVWIRSLWILLRNIVLANTHAADLCWGHPSKSQFRSRGRIPKV